MKERLREARTAMQALFPLGEQLWLDWVGDELEGVAGEEDIPRLRALLEEAVGDYLSIPLWLQLLGCVGEGVGVGPGEGERGGNGVWVSLSQRGFVCCCAVRPGKGWRIAFNARRCMLCKAHRSCNLR